MKMRIEPCLGIPVRYDPAARAICDSRGLGRWQEIVIGPQFLRFPPAEQQAMLLHEAGHCKMLHVKRRLFALLTPWKLRAICREQEFEADRFVRAIGYGAELARAFSRMREQESPLHPPLTERIQRLI
jgi:hypothetical protein